MSKKVLLSAIAILCVLISAPQGVMAKKVVYLGHKYKGDVNKEKIPEGEGEIDIDGLIIKGMFNGNTINNASFESSWIKFDGTATFDETNNVTLKAGGKITKYYYRYEDVQFGDGGITVYPDRLEGVRKRVSETLDKDKVTNTESLTLETATVPVPIELEWVPESINPPTTMLTEISLMQFDKWVNYLNRVDGKILLYIAKGMDKRHVTMKNYKDSDGRIWDYTWGNTPYSDSYSYKVIYPDGGYCSNKTDGKIVYDNKSFYEDDAHWRIVYANDGIIEKGKWKNSVKFSFKYENKPYNFVINNVDIHCLGISNVINGENKKLTINQMWREDDIWIAFNEGYDLSVDIINKIITDIFFDKFDIGDNVRESIIWHKVKYDDNNRYTQVVAEYYKGKYLTLKEYESRIKAEQAANTKEQQAKRQAINQKYGKVYVDAIENAKLLVGMPLKLLVDKDMVYIRQGITVYKMYVFNDGESGQYKVQMYVYTGYNNPDGTPNVGTRTYRVWVKNWKITQFRNWTNNDEREFNRL